MTPMSQSYAAARNEPEPRTMTADKMLARLRRVRPLPAARTAPEGMCRYCRGRGWRDYYDGIGTHLGERICRYCKGLGRTEAECPNCEGDEGCLDPDWDGEGEPPDCPLCAGTGYLPTSLSATASDEPASRPADAKGQEPA